MKAVKSNAFSRREADQANVGRYIIENTHIPEQTHNNSIHRTCTLQKSIGRTNINRKN